MQNYFENNVSEACILMVFETIWNCRENFENNVSKECILTVQWNPSKLNLVGTG